MVLAPPWPRLCASTGGTFFGLSQEPVSQTWGVFTRHSNHLGCCCCRVLGQRGLCSEQTLKVPTVLRLITVFARLRILAWPNPRPSEGARHWPVLDFPEAPSLSTTISMFLRARFGGLSPPSAMFCWIYNSSEYNLYPRALLLPSLLDNYIAVKFARFRNSRTYKKTLSSEFVV